MWTWQVVFQDGQGHVEQLQHPHHAVPVHLVNKKYVLFSHANLNN